MLAKAMLGGVVMVAAGVYLLRSVNFGQLDAGHPLLERVWQMATIAAVVGWFVLIRKAKASAAAEPDRTVAMLATAWGALEGACLLGVAAAILSGAGYALPVAVGVMAVGVGLSWPKPEWFGAEGSAA